MERGLRRRTAIVGCGLAILLSGLPGVAAGAALSPAARLAPQTDTQQQQTKPPPPPPATPPVGAPPAGQKPTEAQPPPVPAVDLDRIKDAISREPRLKLDDGQMRIYMEIVGKWPRFDQIVGDFDLKNGPTPRGAVMTHNEFLAMVTPKEMYSTAGIKPTEMLQFAIVNALGQALIKKALEEIRNARTEREIQAIRDRIDRELAALRGGGGR